MASAVSKFFVSTQIDANTGRETEPKGQKKRERERDSDCITVTRNGPKEESDEEGPDAQEASGLDGVQVPLLLARRGRRVQNVPSAFAVFARFPTSRYSALFLIGWRRQSRPISMCDCASICVYLRQCL